MMRWQIGDVRVTRIVEMVMPAAVHELFSGVEPDALDPHRSWLAPHFIDDEDRLLISVHALVVESEGRRIVVDTCVGNGKQRPFPGWGDLDTRFLDDLTDAGFPPASIDTVLCTHLHFDHVGWNTMLVDGRWVPTFANARYLLGRTEWDHWRQATGPAAAVASVSLADSVQPIFDAGLVDLVESDHHLTKEVSLEPTPGHSPGHHSVVITSRGETAVITGDLVHSPVQFAEPAWSNVADADHELACATRRTFCDRYGDRKALVIGTHFAGPTAGHLVADGSSWRFVGATEPWWDSRDHRG